MKKAILFLVGLIPFVVGYGLDRLLMTVYFDRVFPFKLLGIGFLVCWFLLGLLLCNFAESGKKATMIVSLPGFIVLLLLLFQEIILGHYWDSTMGVLTQFFYLPLLNIASMFGFGSVGIACIAAFLLMAGAFGLGCRLRKKLTK